jgi:DNA-binding NtrC family response regulator
MIQLPMAVRGSGKRRALDLARVLLVHGDLTQRLALGTILQASGYAVDAAATPAEAFAKLDEERYDLVLTDAEVGAGRDVLSYARVKDYRPATGVITSHEQRYRHRSGVARDRVAIYTENLPTLLDKVAELIGMRASRRARRSRPTWPACVSI